MRHSEEIDDKDESVDALDERVYDDDDVVFASRDSKQQTLETRRRIERMMELRILRELDDSIDLDDLDW